MYLVDSCCHPPDFEQSSEQFTCAFVLTTFSTMDTTPGSSTPKRFKPTLDMWINFERNGTKDKSAICRHCSCEVANRADVAQKHLLKCYIYQQQLSHRDENNTPDDFPKKSKTDIM